jgi:hypothetical protein
MRRTRNVIPALLLPVWLSASTAHGITRYVWRDNPAPAPPYTNWATAATTIQAAIDAAATNDEILVTNGVYDSGGRTIFATMTNRVAVDKPVIVRSVNGPDVTTITGNGPPGATAVRCAYVGANAMLAGFRLANGNTRTAGDIWQEQSGGGALCESAGVLSNCIISACAATRFGGGSRGGGLNRCTLSGNSAEIGGGASNGEMTHCALTGNTAQYGGGAYACWLMNCTLSGNSASVGGGANYGILDNCTLSHNVATNAGGVFAAVLANCIVYYNTASLGAANYSGGELSYCCTTPLPGGTGNITNDPGFVSLSETNLRLLATSPCIDAGDIQAGLVGALDLDGNPRVVNWVPDMGAYEYQGVANPDTDGDGIPNAWEAMHGLNPGISNASDANADGDPATDWEEYVADTDPTNGTSYLRVVEAAMDAPPTASFHFVSSTGRLYTLVWTTNLVAAFWLTVPGQGPRAGMGGWDTLVDTNEPPVRQSFIYRVDAQVP